MYAAPEHGADKKTIQRIAALVRSGPEPDERREVMRLVRGVIERSNAPVRAATPKEPLPAPAE